MTVTPDAGAICQLARYEIRPEAMQQALAAIEEFVEYIRNNEPGTLRYEVWQEEHQPTRFVHVFVFKNLEADRAHSLSDAVKKFSGILYPLCLAPIEFIDYRHVAASRSL